MTSLKAIVSERIKELGVSQKEVALQARVNPTYINDIVTGKKLTVQRRFVPTLAFALKINPEIILAYVATKKNSITVRSGSSGKIIIRAKSPWTKALFSSQMNTFQLDPEFIPGRHVPLFLEPLPQDFKAHLKGANTLPANAKYRPMIWPESLGPSEGCYAMTATALNTKMVFDKSILLAAPHRSIKAGNIFIGVFSYEIYSFRLELHRMIDATEREFILADVMDGVERSVPRQIVRIFHRVVAIFEG